MNAIAFYARASADFADKLAQSQDLIRQAGQQHQALSQASSLGPEDMVITHLLSTTQTPATVFVIDTGKLHPQTLALIRQIERRYARSVQVYRPPIDAIEDFEREHGPDAIYQRIEVRKACCALRKLEPLARALAGQTAWLTGLRRQQSAARAQVDEIEQDAQGRIKLNPLARWTAGDVWHFIAQQGIVYNRLHDQFFPSIGCAPCTRAVALGEDIRSGRWWWESESAKECGLHLRQSPLPADSPKSSSRLPGGPAPRTLEGSP